MIILDSGKNLSDIKRLIENIRKMDELEYENSIIWDGLAKSCDLRPDFNYSIVKQNGRFNIVKVEVPISKFKLT